MSIGERIGVVTHYFNHIRVAVLSLEQDLRLGDRVHFLGAHTDFDQEITSMQIEHSPVGEAGAGQEVAVLAHQRVHRGDSVYRLSEEDEVGET
jgi:hypothetical protein